MHMCEAHNKRLICYWHYRMYIEAFLNILVWLAVIHFAEIHQSKAYYFQSQAGSLLISMTMISKGTRFPSYMRSLIIVLTERGWH